MTMNQGEYGGSASTTPAPNEDSILPQETKASEASRSALDPNAVLPQGGDTHSDRNDMSRREVLRLGAFGAAAALGLSRLGGQRGEPARHDIQSDTNRRTFAVTKPITLTLWCWSSDSIIQGEFEAVKAAYGHKYQNVTLSIKQNTGADPQTAENLNLALASRSTLPDIVILEPSEVPDFAVKGALMSLNEYFKPVLGTLYKGADVVAQLNGEYVDFPNELKPKLFYYRQDLFESAGIDPASIPTMTEEDFFRMGETFTAKHPGKYIMNMANEPPEYLFDELISAYAPIGFANPQGKYDITSNPAFAQVLGFMRKIRTSGIAYPVDDFTTDWPAAIESEKICGFPIAVWMDQFLPSYATMTAYGKWGAVPWPALSPLKDQRYGSDAGGQAWVIPVGSGNRNLAAELQYDWHLNRPGAIAAFEASGILPVRSDLEAEVISSVESQKKPASMSETDWLELPQRYFGGTSYIRLKLESQNWVKQFSFDPKSLVDYETIMVDWMYKVVQGKVSVQAGLEGMQSQMEAEVGNPWSLA